MMIAFGGRDNTGVTCKEIWGLRKHRDGRWKMGLDQTLKFVRLRDSRKISACFALSWNFTY